MPSVFTRYQKFVVAVLAFLQFTIVLDFMIISPLGALLLPALHITTRQFGFVVSVYAFSASASVSVSSFLSSRPHANPVARAVPARSAVRARRG